MKIGAFFFNLHSLSESVLKKNEIKLYIFTLKAIINSNGVAQPDKINLFNHPTESRVLTQQGFARQRRLIRTGGASLRNKFILLFLYISVIWGVD